MRIQVMCLSVLFAVATRTLYAQDCHLTLQGHVIEAETNEPLAYARVYIPALQRGTTTDENGAYAIPNLCEKHTYTVEVEHIECEHKTAIVEVTENHHVDFLLAHNAVLKEIVIKEKATVAPSTQANVQLEGIELTGAQGVNLGETLKRLPGVSTLNSGNTVAKPVIQGLHSNRIAIVTNNVVLEGQQWGADHAPEIDPFTAEKITVVKGAAGVKYGAGAIGGAVVMEPAALREKEGWGGWFNLGGASNGFGTVAAGALDWHIPDTKFALRLQGTLKRSGNQRAPDYWLGNTGASEANANLFLGWEKGSWRHQLEAGTFNQKLGVLRAAHTGNLSDLELAIQSDTPRNNINLFTYAINRPYQLVRHQTLRYHLTHHLNDKWKLSAQYAFQFDHRQEYDVVRTATDQPQISFRLWNNALDLSAEHLPIRHWQGGAGIQAKQQLNYVGKGGFIPDYTSFGASVWAMEHWRRYPTPWEFEAGVRYDYKNTHAMTRGNISNIDTTGFFGSLSGTLGLIYHLSKDLTLSANSGLAWRPPHVYELFAKGIHFAAGTYEKGNPLLRQEKAWNTQLNLQYQKQRFYAQLTAYNNRIADFLYLEPQATPVITVRGNLPDLLLCAVGCFIAGA
ncbi:MAG: TonB-dependent receptor [Lewinellaceae bacterium]|nr:TonB-dependent receptor [Lewinellaceae bacterium]